MVGVSLIGCGYWGRNYIKTLLDTEGVKLRWLYNKYEDLEIDLPKGAKFTKNYNLILEDKETDAVILATPPKTHFDIAKKFLENGKDVLVEKPVTCDSNLALKLHKIAEKNSRVLMVGHIFLYNPAIRVLKEIINGGREGLGKILYFYSRRVSLGPIREDISSMWNLAPHDISIINFLTEKVPKRISARGACFLKEGIEDVVDLNLEYDNGISAFVHVGWLEPLKRRDLIIIGDKKTAYFDDTVPNKIRVFEGLEEKNIKIYQKKSPLKQECLHFLECVRERKKPLTDGYNGYVITKILEFAEKSLKNSGETENIIL